MRRALLVGINQYPFSPLHGCEQDAMDMEYLLSRHEDSAPNFECKLLKSSDLEITKKVLLDNIQELFNHQANVALLYFSGHGAINSTDGYIVTQDAIAPHNLGISMTEILSHAASSPVNEIVIILDCCHSGHFGNMFCLSPNTSVIKEGVSILTSSRFNQVSMERAGRGVFTSLITDALIGGAADITGDVTIAGIYSFADRFLGAWDQRPIFKANVTKMPSLRKCNPVVEHHILRKLPEYFPCRDSLFELDPSFEPEASPSNPTNEEIFKHLQKYRDARLLVPVGEEHLYYAAINSKQCKLTPHGMFYWDLAKENKI